MRKAVSLLVACMCVVIFYISGYSQHGGLGSANKILFNAKIFTADVQHPYAEAVAIKGNKVFAVGNLDDVKKLMDATTVLIDMHGQTILPGFVDSHNHAVEGGEGLMRANVDDSVLTVDALAAYADEVQQNGFGMIGNFLVIDGINIETWSKIDELHSTFSGGKYANQPVLLRGSDGHTAWANKALMNIAGINKAFIKSLPASTKKYFNVSGDDEPDGFFADSGFYKVDAVLPAVPVDDNMAAAKGLAYNNALGITAWLDPAAGHIHDRINAILNGYQYLLQHNKLTAHIAAVVVADADEQPQPQVNQLKALQKMYNGNHNLAVLGFKIFADGVIEYPTQTAALSKPYTNSGSYGALMYKPQNFARFAITADKQKLLVHVHAIGDRAVTETLNGFEAARKANGYSGIPHTITHVQVMNAGDIPRFKQLHVLASLQLLWALGDPTTVDIVKPYIDTELYRYQYPARSLLQAGATICGASDWNVSTANPFEAIYEAETRKGRLGVLDSTQCMPRMAMLYAYTINSAKALMMEKTIGSIEAGKYADLVLVDRDVLTVSPLEMEKTQVLWTMFEGKIVYERK
ncbi:MAG TPA: amidohydrolase [Chitinophagaceae bacterium]|nr:amidohydrolase [Chitinophagaceae bacterium]